MKAFLKGYKTWLIHWLQNLSSWVEFCSVFVWHVRSFCWSMKERWVLIGSGPSRYLDSQVVTLGNCNFLLCLGLFCPLLATVSAFGLLLWMGVLYNAIVNVSPFIIACIGVDDVSFLLIASRLFRHFWWLPLGIEPIQNSRRLKGWLKRCRKRQWPFQSRQLLTWFVYLWVDIRCWCLVDVWNRMLH